MKLLKNQRKILKATILIIAISLVLIGGAKYVKNHMSREILLQGCGSSLSSYKYSIKLPGLWDVEKRNLNELDKYSTYYDLQNEDKKITISCTTQGVGDDICDQKYRKTFTVGNQTGQACYAEVNGIWEMGVLNLPTNPSNNSTIALWAHNIDPDTLTKILLTFKIVQ